MKDGHEPSTQHPYKLHKSHHSLTSAAQHEVLAPLYELIKIPSYQQSDGSSSNVELYWASTRMMKQCFVNL